MIYILKRCQIYKIQLFNLIIIFFFTHQFLQACNCLLEEGFVYVLARCFPLSRFLKKLKRQT